MTDAAAVSPGLLHGMFHYKKLPSGFLDKTKVICTMCKGEFAYCRSTTSLKYHLNAKHPLVDASKNASTKLDGAASGVRQTTLDECRRDKSVSTALSTQLTNLLAQWIATNCRPISIGEDDGLELLLQAATGAPKYKLPSRKTISTRIRDQYASEKMVKDKKLTEATFVALTGDHWTSISNQNYLGVTVHLIDVNWELHSFALGV